MTTDFLYTETMQRVCRDAQHLSQDQLHMPLLYAARGCEVLSEWGFDPVLVAGSLTWIIGPDIGAVYQVPFAAARAAAFRKHLPPMHCWIWLRCRAVTVDFSVQYIRARCSLVHGVPGLSWTCPVKEDFFWAKELDTMGSYYQPDETATMLATKHWARLASGPLRWQLDCPECGMVNRDGRWIPWTARYPNERPWVGKRADTVCPACRLTGEKRRAA